jgi:mannose-6-phosphate isomerase-like protein (cupin superfamily)
MMQIVHPSEAHQVQNGKASSVYEYVMEEKEINGAVVKLDGRYPESGVVMNLQCKELVYILKGTAQVVVDGKEISLSEGDMVLIAPNERYFWQGRMTFLITSTPAWSVDQYRHISNQGPVR